MATDRFETAESTSAPPEVDPASRPRGNPGFTAPGDPTGLFVVDQTGKLWRVDLMTGMKTVVLDVSDRLVPLGVCGPGEDDA